MYFLTTLWKYYLAWQKKVFWAFKLLKSIIAIFDFFILSKFLTHVFQIIAMNKINFIAFFIKNEMLFIKGRISIFHQMNRFFIIIPWTSVFKIKHRQNKIFSFSTENSIFSDELNNWIVPSTIFLSTYFTVKILKNYNTFEFIRLKLQSLESSKFRVGNQSPSTEIDLN